MPKNRDEPNRQLNFECTACGKCCFGNEDDYVEITTTEASEIREQLNISLTEFNSKYRVRFADGRIGIRILSTGRCSLLDGNMRCRVYDVRPVQCRTYPFWPEVMNNNRRWQQEARRCEGIGIGPLIPEHYIQQQLALCKVQRSRIKRELRS